MLLELDFQDWGIDLEGVLTQRTWRWFRLRVLKILGDPESRLHKALLIPTQEEPDGPED